MWPPKFSDAIDACNVARRRCERVVTAGLAQPDVNTVASVIVTARDCARIATLTTQLLERGSKRVSDLRRLRAGVRGAGEGVREAFEDRGVRAARRRAASAPRNAASWRRRRSRRAERRIRAGNPKSQAPSSKEIPSSKFRKGASRVGFFWLLGFEISLEGRRGQSVNLDSFCLMMRRRAT